MEKVLNNINRHIKEKLDSNWFTSLQQSLYKPIEKESRSYNKIKLTQEFLDEQPRKQQKQIPADHIHNSKYNSCLQQSLKKLDSSLLKVVIVLEEEEAGQTHSRMAEVEVFEGSNYDELAANALRKL